jgi:hypothetical protein
MELPTEHCTIEQFIQKAKEARNKYKNETEWVKWCSHMAWFYVNPPLKNEVVRKMLIDSITNTSTTPAKVNTNLNSNVKTTDMDSFIQKAKESRSSYKDDKDWARAFSRNYWHTVSNQPGFLPVYTSLLNSITNTSTTQTQVEEVTDTISHMAIEKEADRTPVTPPRPVREERAPDAPRKDRKNIYDELMDSCINVFVGRVKALRNNYHTDVDWARAQARVFYHEVSKEPGFLPVYKKLLASVINQKRTPITQNKEQKGKEEFNRILMKEYDDWYEAFEEEVKEDSERSSSADERWVWHSATVLSRRTKVDRDSLVPVVEAWLLEKNRNNE